MNPVGGLARHGDMPAVEALILMVAVVLWIALLGTLDEPA